MNYKQILFYVIAFIIGLIIGKTIKISVRSGGCPLSRSKLEELRRKLNDDSSENYLWGVLMSLTILRSPTFLTIIILLLIMMGISTITLLLVEANVL